jgi:hypothetical protein
MAIRFPLEYEITPQEIDVGTTWLTIKLKNIGTKELNNLDVRLNSFDPYQLTILGMGTLIPTLAPNEVRDVFVKVIGNQSSSVYITIDGWEDGSRFFWESPMVPISVGQEAAELVNMFAMVEPYPPVGELIRCEAKMRSLSKSPGLELEFWADTNGDFEKIGEVKTKELTPGEVTTYATEFTPEKEGLHTIYTYLYNNEGKRIDREIDMVYVEEA